MPIIEVKNLKKYYRVYKKDVGLLGSIKAIFNRRSEEIKAVDDISFKIEEGELVGFIGPNGVGKTTTLKCLSGLLYPTSGFISVLGFLPHQQKLEFLKQISLVMRQKNQLWEDLPPLENFGLNKEIYEIPEEKYKQTLDELVTFLENVEEPAIEDIIRELFVKKNYA
ncbi:MAG: ATP-binding cassette domain-containing protein [Microgenomates group bacterium]